MSDKVDKYLNKIKKLTAVIIKAIDTINVGTTEDENFFCGRYFTFWINKN